MGNPIFPSKNGNNDCPHDITDFVNAGKGSPVSPLMKEKPYAHVSILNTGGKSLLSHENNRLSHPKFTELTCVRAACALLSRGDLECQGSCNNIPAKKGEKSQCQKYKDLLESFKKGSMDQGWYPNFKEDSPVRLSSSSPPTHFSFCIPLPCADSLHSLIPFFFFFDA